jgi:lipoprotein-anchoring transpeptidase ErfK/SrfK
MKPGAAPITLTLLGASAALWAFAANPPLAQAPSIPLRAEANSSVSAELPAVGRSDRIFLTKAQLKQAMTSGTVDRPIKSLLAVKAPLHFGDFSWNDTAVPQGPTWIRVDLQTQLISVFRSGHEIGSAVIVYGGDNKETPVGTQHILAKARDHRSSLYDAEMPYTLRLTDDGVSIHGSNVRWGAATHGCVGVPLEFARRLFDTSRVGDEVVIIPPIKAAPSRTS